MAATAVGIFATSALVSRAPALVVSQPAPTPPSAADQRRALDDLTRRLARGRETVARVDYRFVRTTPAGPLRAAIVSVNRPPDALEVAFGGVTGRWQGRVVDCSHLGGNVICLPTATAPTPSGLDRGAAALAQLRQLVDPRVGWYTIRPTGSVRLAREPARCFELDATGRARQPVYGTGSEYCVTRDGIVVRLTVRRPDTRDVSTACRVRRRVDDAEIEALLAPFSAALRSTGPAPVRSVPLGS